MGIFNRSIGIRHLVCGSCNGCEHEMNALAGPDYDITHDGWDIVASPRHADVITVTGPMTEAMRLPAQRTLDAIPNPKVIVAIGDCALGCGVFAGGTHVGAGAGVELGATISVPGCPPTPAMIKEGLQRAARALDSATGGPHGSDRDTIPVEGVHVTQRKLG
jgi:Ni,Fe-hydrogenase III small subunit